MWLINYVVNLRTFVAKKIMKIKSNEIRSRQLDQRQ